MVDNKNFKQTEIGGIPKECEVVKVSETGEIITLGF